MIAGRATLTLFALAALAGCADDRPTHVEMLRDGWLYAGPAAAEAPLWCYRTLAEADCHAAPLADAGDRLIATTADHGALR